MNDEPAKRHRMVVEEVGAEDLKENTPIEEISEKVEELKDITEHIEEDVKDAQKVQEEIQEVIAPKQAPSFNPLVIILPGLLLLGALLGGIIFYQKNVNNINPEESPTPSPEEVIEPTASPVASPTATLTKYNINIMNGSGISGEAGKAKTLVETSGFKVGKTGNASSYDFTKTIIKAKSTVEKDYLDALSKALGKNYTVDTIQTLATSSSDDVQIVVGSLKSK